mmetsp:Transcript_13109/g.46085  ORF Transcript_13109/g.46085 Transcript_13109/m.46085 type:complete len:97 (-) Transcript_13109:809-1099(-)
MVCVYGLELKIYFCQNAALPSSSQSSSSSWVNTLYPVFVCDKRHQPLALPLMHLDWERLQESLPSNHRTGGKCVQNVHEATLFKSIQRSICTDQLS